MSWIDAFNDMSATEQKDCLGNKVWTTRHQILEDESFGGCIADTNAFGWEIDSCEMTDYVPSGGGLKVEVDFEASGDQKEGSWPCGTKVSGSAVAELDGNGRVIYVHVSCEVNNEDFAPEV